MAKNIMITGQPGIGKGQPTVGRYVVDLQSFEALALPEVTPSDGIRLYIVDEIGKMEFNCRQFFPMVRQLLNSKALVLATIPQGRSDRQLSEVSEIVGREDVVVVTLNRGNRDAWAKEVERGIREALQTNISRVDLSDMG
eukprot:TRINITY_DN20572_c0_g1_i1.p2 TRINITY_DN20572_c0_g1~~TRINITY_DN20572_c0_g1_i1.p2  ORF type:complete len:140 (-),score=19.49 TRINITY_DN20572_c0_g1_i1:69-488(-)